MNSGVPEFQIDPNEELARFILFSKWFRTSESGNHTVKQDAFIPHPHPDLSVTCHKTPSEQDLWLMGQKIASTRSATLYGRADISAAKVRNEVPLDVVHCPVANNPNHANILNWPADKPSQKIIAQKLAAASCYLPKP